MSAENGLYRVGFETRLGRGAGVAVLRDGEILGGDSMMFYRGYYKVEPGGVFEGEIVTKAHTSVVGMASVFGQNVVHIRIKGTVTAGSAMIQLQGVARENPAMPFNATLTRLEA